MKLWSDFGVALLMVVLAGAVCAEELTGTLKKIKETGAITIGHRVSAIPFSYLDDKQQPIGYAMDLCMKVVDAIEAELKVPRLKINLQAVTPSDRISLLQSGAIDIECGSTTNTVARQQEVAFGPTYFVTNVSAAVKRTSGIKSLAELGGKTIATTSGAPTEALINEYETAKNVRFTKIYGKDHPESFLLLTQGRASAFVMDDILLAGLIADSTSPGDYMIIPESLRQDPLSMMLRKEDPQFKALVDKTIRGVMKSGEINKIYAKWLTNPIPPKGINLKLPQTPAIREAFNNPNDKGVQ
jgi:glutamate/aspartate transport system substrate-binding protein